LKAKFEASILKAKAYRAKKTLQQTPTSPSDHNTSNSNSSWTIELDEDTPSNFELNIESTIQSVEGTP
jgi:hypothetical protein